MSIARTQTLVQLTDELIAALDAEATVRGVSRSALIRLAVGTFLDLDQVGDSPAITIKAVPDDVQAELATRAARAGSSLQDYLRRMLVDSAARPTVDDVIARARARVTTTEVSIDAGSILADRDADRR